MVCCQLVYVVEDDIGSAVFVKNCIFGLVNEASGRIEIPDGNALNGKVLHIESRQGKGFKIIRSAFAVLVDKEDFGHGCARKLDDQYLPVRFGARVLGLCLNPLIRLTSIKINPVVDENNGLAIPQFFIG